VELLVLELVDMFHSPAAAVAAVQLAGEYSFAIVETAVEPPPVEDDHHLEDWQLAWTLHLVECCCVDLKNSLQARLASSWKENSIFLIMSWRSVLSALRIRVAILPVGELSQEEWQQYSGMLDEYAVINTAELKVTAGTSIV
jgi:hypothetical protein